MTHRHHSLARLGISVLAVLSASTASAQSAQSRLSSRLVASPPVADCPLLPKVAVVRQFQGASSATIRYRQSPYPSCTFLWSTQTPGSRLIAGRRVQIPGQGRLTVTRAVLRNHEADWQRVMSSYRSETTTAVNGLGSRAVWSARRSQLSVLGKTHVFHVAAEDSDAPKSVQARAEALARVLLEDER